MSETEQILTCLFRAAVKGADPYAATRSGLESAVHGRSFGARTWVLAMGKASVPMATAALDTLAAAQRTALGGVVITADVGADDTRVLGPLHLVTGDHPVPGDRSQRAADALADVVALVRPGDEAVVLISGGASSLMAAPVDGVSREAMLELFRALHRAGAPIETMNAFRKRVMRWGAGRLAVALSGARVTTLLASDVIGDDPAAIASGPCSGDRWHAAELIDLAHREQLAAQFPDEILRYLQKSAAGAYPETPKPGTAVFESVSQRIILGNRDALDAVAREASALGLAAHVAPTAITGGARSTGAAIAEAAIAARTDTSLRSLNPSCRLLLAWGGETTVALDGGGHGTGGRAQELALAAAQLLHERGAEGRGIAILSGGTDGRDGPTDAAGAVVDCHTWTRIIQAGLDPVQHLDGHDAYPALDAAGALLRTGKTGTNVNDVVLALVD